MSRPAQTEQPQGPRRWRRWAARILILGLGVAGALVATLLVLASGGREAFVWTPPPRPVAESVGTGTLSVTAHPVEALVDEPVELAVAGAIPGSEIIVTASTDDARGVRFESWARFTANAEGRVDLDTSAALQGTYTGRDGGGLLWSMTADDGSLFVTDPEWSARTYRIEATSPAGRGAVEIVRRYPYPEVTVELADGDHWSGQLTRPTSPGPHPAVVLLAGWGDGPAPLSSALLAVRGFAVLNVGYHGWDGLPDEMVEIPVESVTNAIDWLVRQPGIAEGPIGLWGFSRGSELGLIAATADSRIGAVAAWTPSSVVFPGISFEPGPQRSSWTHRGEPLPFAAAPLDRQTLGVTARLLLGRPVAFRPTYASALAVAPDEARIPVENIVGRVLLAAGDDDQLWPAAEMAARVAERIEPSRVTVLRFPDAGHGLRFGLWPNGSFTETFFVRGGSPEASHLAGRKAWAATLGLFRNRLESGAGSR